MGEICSTDGTVQGCNLLEFERRRIAVSSVAVFLQGHHGTKLVKIHIYGTT